jgi:hypothetical protein
LRILARLCRSSDSAIRGPIFGSPTAMASRSSKPIAVGNSGTRIGNAFEPKATQRRTPKCQMKAIVV